MRHPLRGLLLALTLAACSRDRPALCGQQTAGPVRLTPDSIGPIPLWASVAAIRQVCRTAKDTLQRGVATEMGGNTYPAIVVYFPDLKVIGVQWAPTLDAQAPVNVWSVRGANGVLPGGATLGATWKQLSGRGRGMMSMGPDSVKLMFCDSPGLFLHLRGAPRPAGHVDPNDLSQIPGDWVLQSVEMGREKDEPGWHC